MENLTLEALPKAIVELSKEINEIKTLLLQRNLSKEPKIDQLMNIQQTAAFLNLSTATIYSMVSRNAIPCMKRTKRLYFSADELTVWLKASRKSNLGQYTDLNVVDASKRKGGAR